MTVAANYAMNLTLQDAASANALVTAPPSLTANGLDENGSLNSGTTPAVSMVAAGSVTMTSGAVTLDLRTLTGLDGSARDGNGLKVVLAKFKNNSTHAVTIAKGASSGFTGFGSGFSLALPAGGTAEFYFSTGGTAISPTVKTLDISGTGTDTLQYEFGMG